MQKGFSLVELMVVVAIIGLLATIGIPQYARFQGKSRTVEARANLAALYVAEKAFSVEWEGFTVDLKSIGFSGTGRDLRYVIGFASGVPCAPYPANAPAEDINNCQSVATGVFDGTAMWNATIATPGVLSAELGASTCTSTSFTALAVGDPRNTPTALVAGSSDTWQINQNKSLTNTVVNF